MKNLFYIIAFFGCFVIQSQTKKANLQVYSFEEVEKLHQQNPKSIVVFIYTNWCKICHGMKKNTFKNDEIIDLLNNQFYFVKLNAEQKENISFLGKTYVYKPSGNKTGINELALELATIDGEISYPTTTILNTKLEINLQIDSFINSKKMKNILEKYLKLNQ